MRGAVPGLPSPHPIGPLLPGVYQEDDFVQRWCAGLDCVLAPLLATLDSFDAYLDPAVAPEDFLSWLGEWLGVSADHRWPVERRRELVVHASDLYHWRGTRRGLAGHLALATGVVPEIDDSGGAAWSTGPSGPLPGRPQAEVVARFAVEDPAAFDAAEAERALAGIKPAHVRHRVEVVPR